MRQCKKCITLHVDNWNPDTYKFILEEIDVPYIKDEWDKLLAKYGSDPTKLTGMTILGRYLSKMKLNQWNKYRWADSEKLELEVNEKKIATMRAAGYTGEEIEQELATNRTPARPADLRPPEEMVVEEEPDEFADTLTEEDKLYLRMKWGKGYRADEWVKME